MGNNKRSRAASPPDASPGSTPANRRQSIGESPHRPASPQKEDLSTKEPPAKRPANQGIVDLTDMEVDNDSLKQGTPSRMAKPEGLGPGQAHVAADVGNQSAAGQSAAPARGGPSSNVNAQPAANQPAAQPPPAAANPNVQRDPQWQDVPLELLPAGVRVIAFGGGWQNPGQNMVLFTLPQLTRLNARGARDRAAIHALRNEVPERRRLGLPAPQPPLPAPQITANQVANTRLVTTTLVAEQGEYGQHSRIVFLRDCMVPPSNDAGRLFDAVSSKWGRDQQASFQCLAVYFDRTLPPAMQMPLQVLRSNVDDLQAMLELISRWPGWTENPLQIYYLKVVVLR